MLFAWFWKLFYSVFPRSNADDEPVPKKKVCVIGAGASGLVTMKELVAEGHDVEAFEATGFVGGSFSVGADQSSANRSYKSLYLTISNNYMAFSDFPPKDEWKYWTGKKKEEQRVCLGFVLIRAREQEWTMLVIWMTMLVRLVSFLSSGLILVL
jgi:cation diffusion facilitator CzcD-associated flavoprotein CzcO